MSEISVAPARRRRTGLAAGIMLGALIAGLLLGILVAQGAGAWREPMVQAATVIGGLWLDALRMTVIPLIVALLITGIVGGADAARAGGLAARAVGWFMAFYIFSAAFGAAAMSGLLAAFPLPVEAAAALRAGLSEVDPTTTAAAVPTVADFFRSIVPTNPMAAAANDQILPLVVFTVIFAFALSQIDPAKRLSVLGFFDAVGDAMLKVIGWVLWLAPIGVFALAFAVGAGAGSSALGAVVHYVILISALGAGLTLLGYAIASMVGRFEAVDFARAMAGPSAVAVSTRSSLASLPAMLSAAAALGIGQRRADILLPLAVALFRATGPAMNIGVVIYVAHLVGVGITPLGFAVGIAVAAMASIGAVSLPGQISFVTSIAPIAIAMGVPIEPLALLLALETIPDIFRTLGNVTLDVAVTGAVSRQAGPEDSD